MAFVAMTTRSAGYVVPASEWNQLIANDNYLKTQSDTAQLLVKVIGDAQALTVGDDQIHITIPAWVTGWNLVAIAACVYTVSSSGLPTIQLRNVTDSVDMLSTSCSIDASEFSSYSAATPAVIDTSKDDVATGDRLSVDCDIAGTGTLGLETHLKFQPA